MYKYILFCLGLMLFAACDMNNDPEMTVPSEENQGVALEIALPTFYTSFQEHFDEDSTTNLSVLSQSRAFLASTKIEVSLYDGEKNLLLDESEVTTNSSPLYMAKCYFPNVSLNTSVFAVMKVYSLSDPDIPVLSGSSDLFTVKSGFNEISITLVPTNPQSISIPFTESMSLYPTLHSGPYTSGDQYWYEFELDTAAAVTFTALPFGDSYAAMVLADSSGERMTTAISLDFMTNPPVYGGEAIISQTLEAGRYYLGVMGVAHVVDQKYDMQFTVAVEK